jgi:hypothetical protein
MTDFESMAIIMWCSLTGGFSMLFLPALALTITALLYLISWVRKEGRTTSAVTGGTGIASTATSAMGAAASSVV